MDKIQRATDIHCSMTPHQMALRIVEMEDESAAAIEAMNMAREVIDEGTAKLEEYNAKLADYDKRITELQDALALAEEAVLAKQVPAPVIEHRDKLLDAMRQTLAMLRVTSHGPSAANKAEDMLHAAICSIGTSHAIRRAEAWR